MIRTGIYRDSVRLLQISAAVLGCPGVTAALVAMATPLNVDLLRSLAFVPPAHGTAGEGDLLVAVRADDATALAAAVALVESELVRAPQSGSASPGELPPRTMRGAVARSGATVAVISVPGPYVVPEAVDALRGGADVFVFSDGVPIADEVALKTLADGLDRLVMGPDCGTALVDGVGLGFANRVPPGPVGIVAASGTGAQHLSCLLAGWGVGVGQIIGVGGRDLHAAVGGRSTLRAMRRLDADPTVELVVVLSKPPAPEIAARVGAAADALATPVVLGLLGDGQGDLTGLARAVARAVGVEPGPLPSWLRPDIAPLLGAPLCGLFAGGTLATEAAQVARTLGRRPLGLGALDTAALATSVVATWSDLVIDLGDDALTAGRAHPMIDPTLRVDVLRAVAAGPVRVVLLDVVCGIGAQLYPAADLVPVIAALVAAGSAVVVSLVGAADDPQRPEEVAARLHEAGAQVLTSNADAARLAVGLAFAPPPGLPDAVTGASASLMTGPR